MRRSATSHDVLIGFALALLAATTGAGACATDPGPLPPDGLTVEVVARGLTNPVFLTAPSGDPRLFVVEQGGRIVLIVDGALRTTPFLDIGAQVGSGGERGLLGLAFHPNYAANEYFYVNYTDTNGDTRVERYTVSADPGVADATSAALILGVEQPYANHNGGEVLFGPDGMLYVGLGDGGSGGDPEEHGQNRGTLLGSLLRLDVDGGTPYGVPGDDPFVSDPGAQGEIWAYGLRNPWRFAFDPADGLLYVADVGQSEREEVNVVPAGAGGVNFGWNVMEGTRCYGAEACDRSGLTLPVLDYETTASSCSVIGGFVYRGAQIPEVRGHYFYSDWCGGWLRSFRFVGGAATERREWAVGALGPVLSFGQDAAGELYILSGNGTVYRLARAE